MDKIKKLSDAIRLGATFRPQCRGEFFTDEASCALGAAAESTGLHPATLSQRFPELCDNVKHPLPRWRHHMDLFRTITNLNDCHDWTRERIADWVASIGY